MAFLSSLDISGSALTAERYRMDVILQNIANASTPATNAEDTYKRKQVIFQERPLTFRDNLSAAQRSLTKSGGVRVTQVVENERDPKPVYDPTNPIANEDGYVMYPNVDTTEERVDLMAASNAYIANITALSVVKATTMKALEIGQ
jgi:flagellar basal-body rod protein FlgC